uniref:Uncharacterized protein n=1 Tax=Oryza brachyantha TaxID=4533 RepID=J3MEA1_ORYBR
MDGVELLIVSTEMGTIGGRLKHHLESSWLLFVIRGTSKVPVYIETNAYNSSHRYLLCGLGWKIISTYLIMLDSQQ